MRRREFITLMKRIFDQRLNSDYEGMLELFPKNYYEPYYESYINEDFCELASDCGLTSIRTVDAFVSKVMVFDKPASNAEAD